MDASVRGWVDASLALTKGECSEFGYLPDDDAAGLLETCQAGGHEEAAQEVGTYGRCCADSEGYVPTGAHQHQERHAESDVCRADADYGQVP